MWYIETDNVVRIKNLQNVETEAYVNNATVTGILYKLPALNPDAGGAVVDKSPGTGVGIPITAHGMTSLSSIRIEGSVNYNGDFTVELGTTVDEIVINAPYVAETLIGDELIYEAIVGAVLSPISFTYVTGSNGDYVGRIPRTANLIQDEEYMMCVWEITGTEQVLAKIVDVAGFRGL